MTVARTFSLYIGRQFALWCGGVFGAMLVIIFLLDFVELLRRGASKSGATLTVLLEMAALKLPHMGQELMPFAVLFGTMLAFWRLTRTHELVAARAAGVSAWQFLAPAMALSLLVGMVTVAVFNPVAAVMQGRYESLDNRILRGGTGGQFAVFRTGLWLREADEKGLVSVIHADRISPRGLENFTVLRFDERDRFVSRIDAPLAQLEDGFWRLTNGIASSEDASTAERFAERRIPTGFTYERMRESFASPDTMSFWKLPQFIRLLEDAGFSALRHRLHYNELLARPVLLAGMVMLAAGFSLRLQRRGGVGSMVAAGVLSGFLLFFFSDVIFALGLSGTIPVELAAWTPAGVCLLASATLLLHLEEG